MLRAHPVQPEVLDLPPESLFELPSDCSVLFAPVQRAVHGDSLLRPERWPGALAWIQLPSAGVDEYPAWLLDAPLVTSAQGTTAPAIAEFVLAMLLMREKQIPALFARDEAGWPVKDERLTRSLGTLRGKRLGLIGMGAIGSAVTELAVPFGMHVVAARRSGTSPGDPRVTLAPLDDVLAASDHLVVACPLTPETRGLLDDRAFAKLKRGAHLVNIARGAIVDPDALVRALAADPALTATLDVTDPEPLPDGHALYANDRVRISPHLSFSSPRVMEGVVRLFVENVSRFAEGRPLLNVVDRERGY